MEKANRADLPGPQVSTRLSLSQGSITFNENIEVQNPRFQSPVLSGKHSFLMASLSKDTLFVFTAHLGLNVENQREA